MNFLSKKIQLLTQIVLKTHLPFCILLVFTLNSCKDDSYPEPYSIDFENIHIEYASSGYFEELGKQIDAGYFGNLSSIIAFKDNQLIYEKYFSNYTEQSQFYIHKITGAITSLLTGIAIDKGFIESPDSKLSQFYPYYTFDSTQSKYFNEITIHEILTMSSGYPNNGSWKWKDSVITTILNTNIREDKSFYYFPGMYMVLSDIIEKTSGMKIDSFANKYLFGPLDITDYRWSKHRNRLFRADGAGEGLHLTTRDLAKIGLLCSNKGNWQGKQLISEYWIRESKKKWIYTRINSAYSPSVPYFGYGFYVKDKSAFDYLLNTYTYYARGGTPHLWIIPSHNLVVVTFSSPSSPTNNLEEMVYNYFIPATTPDVSIQRKTAYNYFASPSDVAIDGDFSEWQHCDSVQLLYRGDKNISKTDFSGSAKIAWNPAKPQSIYLSFSINDYYFRQGYESKYDNDILEISFDFNNTGRTYKFSYATDGANTFDLANATNSKWKVKKNASYLAMEIEITPREGEELYHELLNFEARPNKDIGMNITYYDVDNTNFGYDEMSWAYSEDEDFQSSPHLGPLYLGNVYFKPGN